MTQQIKNARQNRITGKIVILVYNNFLWLEPGTIRYSATFKNRNNVVNATKNIIMPNSNYSD